MTSSSAPPTGKAIAMASPAPCGVAAAPMRATGDGAAPVPDMLSTQELAAKFGRSPRTIRRWAQRGDLVPIRVGGGVFYRAEDVRRLIGDRMTASILQRKALPSVPMENECLCDANILESGELLGE